MLEVEVASLTCMEIPLVHESTSHFWGAKVARLLKAGKISSPAIVIPTEPDKKDVCLSVRLSVCVSVCLCVCVSVCLSVCL